MGLSMEMKKDISKEINCIIEETTQEEKLRRILPESFPNEDILKKMGEESVEYSDEKFESLSEKHRLNGFYLQELIHCYAEKISNTVLNNI